MSKPGPVPPNSPDAEKRVLCAMMMNAQAIDEARTILKPADFYHSQRATFFEAMSQMRDKGLGVNSVTLTDYMQAAGMMKPMDAYIPIDEIMLTLTSWKDVRQYAEIVHAKAILRRLYDMGRTLARDAVSEKHDPAALTAEAMEDLSAMTLGGKSDALVAGAVAVEEALAATEKAVNEGRPKRGIPSGLSDLDYLTAGWNPGNLVIVAARPSVGKTALAIQMAMAAAQAGKGAVIFSLEMSREDVAYRLMAQETPLDLALLRSAEIGQDGLARVKQRASEIGPLLPHIDDTPSVGLSHLRVQCRRLQSAGKLDIVFIDYLQLMSPPTKKDRSREQEVSAIARGLKGLAGEFHVPVVALSQLNRAGKDRADKRPILSDLRESGELEQASDTVVFIHRPESYLSDPNMEIDVYDRKMPAKGLAEIIVSKQRNGPTGYFWCQWDATSTRFTPLDLRHSAPEDAAAEWGY